MSEENKKPHKFTRNPYATTYAPEIPESLKLFKEACDNFCAYLDVRIKDYGQILKVKVPFSEATGSTHSIAAGWLKEVREGGLYAKVAPKKQSSFRDASLGKLEVLCGILEVPPEQPALVNFKIEVDSRYPGKFNYP